MSGDRFRRPFYGLVILVRLVPRVSLRFTRGFMPLPASRAAFGFPEVRWIGSTESQIWILIGFGTGSAYSPRSSRHLKFWMIWRGCWNRSGT